LGTLLTKANSISYFGLEISETMYVEAQRINQEIKNGKQIEFNLYDGENIPFEDNSFDRIMTVNSLYFWSSPEELFKEIGRTLKPGGYCVVTFARKDYLKQLPFVRQKFKMYDVEDIQNFIDDSNMEIVHIEDKVELNESKTGKKDERKYFMVKMTKK
jgi:SAM-dependent methyltransferase